MTPSADPCASSEPLCGAVYRSTQFGYVWTCHLAVGHLYAHEAEPGQTWANDPALPKEPKMSDCAIHGWMSEQQPCPTCASESMIGNIAQTQQTSRLRCACGGRIVWDATRGAVICESCTHQSAASQPNPAPAEPVGLPALPSETEGAREFKDIVNDALTNALCDAELPVCPSHVDAEFVCPECFKEELAAWGLPALQALVKALKDPTGVFITFRSIEEKQQYAAALEALLSSSSGRPDTTKNR